MKEEKEEEEEDEKEEEEEDEKAAAEYGPDTAAKAAGEEPQFTMRVFHTSRCSEEVDRRSRPAGACFKLGMESQRFVPEVRPL